MLALEAERPGLGPAFDHQVVRFIEKFPVVRRADVVKELLAARAAHPSGDQAPARNHIDLGQFLGQPDRIAHHRQRIAQQHDLHLFGDPGQDCGLHVHHRAHAEGGAVMFVEHHAVQPHLLHVHHLVKVRVVQIGAFFGVEEAVGNAEKSAVANHLFLGNITVGPLVEIQQLHRSYPLPNLSLGCIFRCCPLPAASAFPAPRGIRPQFSRHLPASRFYGKSNVVNRPPKVSGIAPSGARVLMTQLWNRQRLAAYSSLRDTCSITRMDPALGLPDLVLVPADFGDPL